MQSDPLKILRRLQAFGYESAIIAGGAIRDDFTKKEITDYDIFLWDPRHSKEFINDDLNMPIPAAHAKYLKPKMNINSSCFEMDRTTEFVDLLQTLDIEQIFDSVDYGPLQKVSTSATDDPLIMPGVGAHLTSIWEAEFDFTTYQLIYTQVNPVNHVNDYFDIGLCKAYCDGKKLRYTPDFMYDLKNRKLTIVGTNMNQDQFNYAVDHHVEKLWKKYPNFELQVAPHNLELFIQHQNR